MAMGTTGNTTASATNIIAALKSLNWEVFANAENGKTVAAILTGDEAVKVEKVDGDTSHNYEETSGQLFIVVKVAGKLFRKTGYYQSHYGSEWDGDIREVREASKTVTVYEEV